MSLKSPVQNSEFISLATAATLVNYSRYYLGRLAREGKIISQQIDKQWFINRESLLHFFEQSTLEDSLKKKILSLSRKNDLEVKDIYRQKISTIEARAGMSGNKSLFATICIIACGLLSGVLIEKTAVVVALNPQAQVAQVLLAVLSPESMSAAAVLAPVFDETIVTEIDEKIPMQNGVVIFPAGTQSADMDTAELFSDDVTVVVTSTTTGFVRFDATGRELPFVRVPAETQ